MNRRELQRLADARLRDAEELYRAQRYAGAFYLAGYAIECALKACIAKNTRKGDFPDLDTVRRSYTHRLDELVKIAGLDPDRRVREQSDPNFRANWVLLLGWSEASRYERRSRSQARDLLDAIFDSQSGILPWIKTYW